ncbi:MAG: (2Fe-2S)-binding protein [Defluviitaleaceae bacterium]|nr:(2Fe-2S)-binding protein [Defluviitaleaceae bacterium]
MDKTLEKTGIPTTEQVESAFPPQERLDEGAVAIIECFQRIPCNPCATSCPRGAIVPFEDINDTPVIKNENCNGCTLCITKCPGLAIMVVDTTWKDPAGLDRALIKLPYEFRPLPAVGDEVIATDRAGAFVTKAEVVQVLLNHAMNKVPIVTIAVEKSLMRTVRGIHLDARQRAVVCRCNDLDEADIAAYIAGGATSIDELKRVTRLGMGPCQGRNCVPIVQGMLARTLGVPVAELSPGTYRPTVKSIALGDLAEYDSARDELGDGEK